MSKIEVYSRGLRGALGLVDVEHVYFLYTDDAGRQWSLSVGGPGSGSDSLGGPGTRFQVQTSEFVPGTSDYNNEEEHTRLGLVTQGPGTAERALISDLMTLRILLRCDVRQMHDLGSGGNNSCGAR
jgi:hypothetical protein